MTTPAAVQIRQKYRSLNKLVKKLPENDMEKSLHELRTSFRKALGETESVETRLQDADNRISFLQMITPKDKPAKGGTWVYKDGKRIEGGSGTRFDANGNVHSNWDGKNLDPCSVKRHNQQLNRVGFLNNQHAKGYF
ncbi:unnamed protein product [Cylindrotheca closterium]|uniref:Uncharacterized protein n=1 Tax=Cylindrotheca closterium TaxID=2856 RepID=A0AAD2GDF1_9STRA|nr:unnamed protein product [Cylindrotheca closterium]